MFHCNGWAYPWAVTAMGAKHVCLPEVEAEPIWRALTEEGVTHLCAAPTVLTTIIGADEAEPLDEPAQVFVGGAPPSPALLEKGAGAQPPDHPPLRADRDLRPARRLRVEPRLGRPRPREEQARLRARQGVGPWSASACAWSTRRCTTWPPTARRSARSSCAATT